METESTLGILIVIFTGLATFKGFSDKDFFDSYLFDIEAILGNKERNRLISSGFLHSSWWHFGFNMLALTAFSWSVEAVMGVWKFALIYFLSLIGGNLLALFIHRNHTDYRAVGASGAISGVIFAAILLFPNQEIWFMPSWLFGSLFLIISIFGIKSQFGNIGHEAHLGGAIIGMLMAIGLAPQILTDRLWLVLLFLIPVGIFLFLLIRNPHLLLVENYWGEEIERLKEIISKSRKEKKISKQEELDGLLDKIRIGGIKSLSKSERTRLKELSE